MHNLNFRRLWFLAVLALLTCEGAIAQRGGPSAPAGLTIEILNPDNGFFNGYGAQLKWQASPPREEVRAYNLYVKSIQDWGSGEGEFSLFKTVETNQTTITTADLEIGSKAYAYYVTAVSQSGESEPSNAVSSACGRPWNEGDLGQYNGSGNGEIITDPEQNAYVGEEYTYDVGTFAEYSTEHKAVYTLSRAPEGMQIEENTGKIRWIPEQEGRYTIVVDVSVPSLNEKARQIWEVEVVGKVASVNDRAQLSATLQLFPNPTAKQVTLQFKASAGEELVQIIDSRGSIVESRVVETTEGTNSLSFDVSSLSAGSYLIAVGGTNSGVTIPLRIVR